MRAKLLSEQGQKTYALVFDTGDAVMKNWTGAVVGAGESIRFICTGADKGSRQGSQELEARRVP